MSGKLFSDRVNTPISPLIDVVMNGLAVVFIILMVYMAFARPGVDTNTIFLPTARVEIPYAEQLDASKGIVQTASDESDNDIKLIAGELPPDLDLHQNGLIDGIPSTPGTYRFEVSSGKSGKDRKITYQLEVLDDLKHTLNLPIGRVGESYLGQVTTSGRRTSEQFLWEVDVDGLRGSKSKGIINGIPTIAGNYPVSYEIRTKNDRLGKGDGTLRILPKRTKLKVGGVTFMARVGKAIDYAIPFEGAVEPVFISSIDSVGFNVIDGKLTGTPQEAGVVTTVVKIEDAAGNSAEGEVKVHVRPEATALKVDMDKTIYMAVGEANRKTLAALGGEAVYSWEVTGELPPGIELKNNNLLKGQLLSKGEWPVEVTVTDMITEKTASKKILFVGIDPRDQKDAKRQPRSICLQCHDILEK